MMAENDNKAWRLGADLGSNSLGWAAIQLDEPIDGKPIAILASGSRIFSDGRDPKSGASDPSFGKKTLNS